MTTKKGSYFYLKRKKFPVIHRPAWQNIDTNPLIQIVVIVYTCLELCGWQSTSAYCFALILTGILYDM